MTTTTSARVGTARPATEPLRRFLEMARGAGMRISAAEGIDAVRTLEVVGYGDRVALKDALSFVLAKTPEEKLRYDEAFELYFTREMMAGASPGSGVATPGAAGTPSLGSMLESNDSAAMAIAVETAAHEVGVAGIRYFTQRALYARRILQHMGLKALQEDLDALRDAGDEASVARAVRLSAGLENLKEVVRQYVERHLTMFGRADAERFREELLKTSRLSGISERDMGRMRLLVRQMARKLAARYAKMRRRKLRGQLDTRRTIRRNVGWGGVPFVTYWKERKIEKPHVMVLCDVSGSVADVSQFLLMFLYALNEALSGLRAFAFAGSLVEVSDILERQPIEQAIVTILQKIGFQSSNYGNALTEFDSGWMRYVTPKTTVIVVGDARGNNADPRIEIFSRLSKRCRRIIWLNPEYPTMWGTGDSDMLRYAPYCSLVRVCNTLEHLDRAVTDMLAQQN